MKEIIKSIYFLLGKHAKSQLNDWDYGRHADDVFEMLDRNHDDVITIEEFIESCINVE